MRRLAGKKVLVLEDDILLGMDLSQMLEDEGATVLGPFGSIGPASRACRTERPEFALLDFNLGGGTSEAFARLLQSEGVPFAFLTGYARAHLPERFAGVGLVGKPVTIEDVVDAISASQT